MSVIVSSLPDEVVIKTNCDKTKKNESDIEELIPVFPEPALPKTIRVAKIPLTHPLLYQEVPVDDFLKMIHRKKWTETTWLPTMNKSPSLAPGAKQVLIRLLSTHSKYLDFLYLDMGEFGSGVTNLKPIPKGACILYSGIKRAKSDYRFNCHTIEMSQNKTGHTDPAKDFLIDASEYGNAASLFQHAPYSLEGYTFSNEEIKGTVQTANWDSVPLLVGDQYFILLRSNRDIAPLELMTIDYGPSFWKKLGKNPTLFDNQFNPVSCKHYRVLEGVQRPQPLVYSYKTLFAVATCITGIAALACKFLKPK